jgi:4-hydroxybenzoate polyprenyltransferase
VAGRLSAAPRQYGRALAVGRLLRVSLAPSAAADAIAGASIGGAAWPLAARAWLLALGSLCVFCGGMALNDWADRARDARHAPARPIPSGAIAPRAALAIAIALLSAGPLLALAADRTAGALLGAVAAAAALYDLALRGALAGPLALGACRAGNLAAGIALGAGGWPTAAWLPAAAYGAYVACVSWFALDEDSEAPALGSAPRARLALAALALAGAPWSMAVSVPVGSLAGVHGLAAFLAACGLATAGAWPLARRAASPAPFAPPEVRAFTGALLRRLLLFTAALALARGTPAGWLAGGVALAGYPLAYALRRAFPPT